jgi:hypothetical protein
MNKIWVQFLTVIVLAFFVNIFSAPISAQEKYNVKDTEAILISIASVKFFDAPEPQGDEAMLITDKAEITKFVKLFNSNSKSVTHACGYHWRITFVGKSATSPTEIFFNQKCEEFVKNTAEICELVQTKFREIRASPTHFVTNLAIGVNITPAEAMLKLEENKNFVVFALDDPEKRFPSIEIEATAAGDIPENRKLWDKAKNETVKKIEMIFMREIEQIKKKYPVLKTGESYLARGMFGGGKIDETHRTKIIFAVGTNLNEIEKSLSAATVVQKTEPTTYFLQLVGTERFSPSMSVSFKENYSFVKSLSAYPQ